MKNLKIGARLALSFGTLMVLMGLVILVGIQSLANQNNNADRTINDVYPKVVQAQELSYLAMDNARLVRNLILNKDTSAIASNSAIYYKNNDHINEILAKLEASTQVGKERELVQNIKSARTEFRSYNLAVVGLALKNDDDAATKMLYGEKYVTQATYLRSLKNFVEYEEKTMQGGGVQTNAAYYRGLYMMLGLGFFSVLIGVLVSVLITSGLLKQLGGEPNYAASITGKVAQGDLISTIDLDPDDQSSLLYAIKSMRDNLGNIVMEVRSSTESIAAVSGEVAQGNLDLSSRTESQAAALQETASSMEELMVTVKQNSENAHHANKLAQKASAVALKGGDVVSQVVTTMSDINDSSRKVVDIISVIDGIAFQTNILALNAAVEAARAGEQGRGFAVVASEVRNLAQRSAAAAKEIKELISDSVTKVEVGSNLVDEAGKTMNEVVGSIRQVNEIVSAISVASDEQAQNIEQINQAISEMDNATQQNAALVEEAAAAAKAMQDQSGQLAELVSVFKLSESKISPTNNGSKYIPEHTVVGNELERKMGPDLRHVAKSIIKTVEISNSSRASLNSGL